MPDEQQALIPASNQVQLPVQSPGPGATFKELIACMAAIDQVDELPPIDFAGLAADLRDKVDNLHYVIQRMEAVAAFLKDYTAPYDKKRRAIERAREQLREYVARSMRGDFLPEDQRQCIEQVPGDVYFVRLRDSPPSFNITRQPTARDYERYGDKYVEMRRSYVWRSDVVKETLLARPRNRQRCRFAEITRGVWPEWRLKIPEVLEKKRKGAKTK